MFGSGPDANGELEADFAPQVTACPHRRTIYAWSASFFRTWGASHHYFVVIFSATRFPLGR